MSNTASTGAGAPETEALLQRAIGMVAGARALPLSSSVKLDNKEELLELLREASERLPEELRQARWMMKEREEFLAATQRKADELVEAARSEAQRMVQRTEIVKQAEALARRTLEEARDQARRLRLEAEDYADQKLAQFEIVLQRTLKTVAAGRAKLAGGTGTASTAGPDEEPGAPEPAQGAPLAEARGAPTGDGGPPAVPPRAAPRKTATGRTVHQPGTAPPKGHGELFDQDLA
ncbi:MAG: DivIVA domain-containing protein [Acidimicrobiales bacterium]